MAFYLIMTIFSTLISASLASLCYTSVSKKTIAIISCIGAMFSAIFGLIVWLIHLATKTNYHYFLSPFIQTKNINLFWSFYIDPLGALFCFFVPLLAAVVHFYSLAYMNKDEGQKRFMIYLNLFTFFAMILATSGNFVQMFFGWEGINVISYLLICFWFEKSSARAAGFKTFFINRIASMGFIFAICALGNIAKTFEIRDIFTSLEWGNLENIIIPYIGSVPLISTIGFAFLFASLGKSAQFGFHIWLPDAMEAPLPVSALLHSVVMVSAGIFLLFRINPIILYSPNLSLLILTIGLITAILTAWLSIFQIDIKRCLAYATSTQFGLMFASIGASAPVIAIFHLFTHAFLQVLLFLGVGSIISTCETQDLRKMGHLYHKMPYTFLCVFIGVLSLCGIPPFSGFFSKEAILRSIYSIDAWYQPIAFYVCILAMVLGGIYLFRMLFLIFFAENHLDELTESHAHESSKITLISLIFLLVFAIFGGLFSIVFAYIFQDSKITNLEKKMPYIFSFLILVLMSIAIWIGYKISLKQKCLKQRFSKDSCCVFCKNRGFCESIYEIIFIKPFVLCSKLISNFEIILDKYFFDSLARACNGLGYFFHKFYTAQIPILLISMIIGWAAIILYGFFRGGFL